ncbi:hypothetical protein [Chitinophaga sancti]
MEKETSLSVISEVLGHSRMESTMCYLRVDMQSLRKCVLCRFCLC